MSGELELAQHVDLQRTEATAERDLLRRRDALVAEHEHVMVEVGTDDRCEGRVVERAAEVEAQDFRTDTLSHSLNPVYPRPNAIVSPSTRPKAWRGQAEEPESKSATVSELRAINRSPPVHWMIAKACSDRLPDIQIVYSGSWRVSQVRLPTAMTET